jgi:hypothetical protein
MCRAFLVLWICLAAGCKAEIKDELVPPEKMPANFLDTARETLPEVTFEQVLKRADGRYEVRGKDKRGKVRIVNLSATGEALEIE